jgi:integrase
MFTRAQRAGRFPPDKQLPTLGLAREDFADIGWKARERVSSERELHQLFDALGIGAGERIEIDLKKSPRIALASRLAVLLLLHVPVRSGAGILSQRTSAADRKAKVLRWRTRKGRRVADLETPLSSVALDVLSELEQLKGGKVWIVPSPEEPEQGKPWQHIDMKVLARLFARLQSQADGDEEPRVVPVEGQEPFTPHSLRALWVTLAGEVGIEDGVAVRVIGHQPEGASKAQRFYDRSQRLDAQRDAVERVSSELERIRRRLPVASAKVVEMMSGAKP